MFGAFNSPITTRTLPSTVTVTVTETIVQPALQEQEPSTSAPSVNADSNTGAARAPSLSSSIRSGLPTAQAGTSSKEIAIFTVTVTADFLTTVTGTQQPNRPTAIPATSQALNSVQVTTPITLAYSTIFGLSSSMAESLDAADGNIVSSEANLLGPILTTLPRPGSRTSSLQGNGSSPTVTVLEPSSASPSKPPTNAVTDFNVSKSSFGLARVSTTNPSNVASLATLASPSPSQRSGEITNGTWLVSEPSNNGTATAASQSNAFTSVIMPTGGPYTAVDFSNLANSSSILTHGVTINASVTTIASSNYSGANAFSNFVAIKIPSTSNSVISSSGALPSGSSPAIAQVSIGNGQSKGTDISGSVYEASGNQADDDSLPSAGPASLGLEPIH